jgi:hypothetical protein
MTTAPTNSEAIVFFAYLVIVVMPPQVVLLEPKGACTPIRAITYEDTLEAPP